MHALRKSLPATASRSLQALSQLLLLLRPLMMLMVVVVVVVVKTG